jgi:hypothetical protein
MMYPLEIDLPEKLKTLKTFAQLVYGRFDNSVKDLNEAEAEWKPVSEANNIKWILTHLSQQWNIGIIRAVKCDPTYKPADWPDDYVGNKSYSLAKIMKDLQKGRENVLMNLEKLNPADLDADINTPRGVRKRETMLMIILSEIPHHEGQIAYIRGAVKRRKETEPGFLE